MRTIGRWVVGFFGLLWDIFIVWPFMITPVALVACIAWIVYTFGFALGLAVLAGWGLYQVYPVGWAVGVVAVLAAIVYWWTIWFIYNESDGWPYVPASQLVRKIMISLPMYEFD